MFESGIFMSKVERLKKGISLLEKISWKLLSTAERIGKTSNNYSFSDCVLRIGGGLIAAGTVFYFATKYMSNNQEVLPKPQQSQHYNLIALTNSLNLS